VVKHTIWFRNYTSRIDYWS